MLYSKERYYVDKDGCLFDDKDGHYDYRDEPCGGRTFKGRVVLEMEAREREAAAKEKGNSDESTNL